MPALTRRRDSHRQECWRVYYSDVHVITLGKASIPESHLGHFRKHALHERRIAIDAAWLQ